MPLVQGQFSTTFVYPHTPEVQVVAGNDGTVRVVALEQNGAGGVVQVVPPQVQVVPTVTKPGAHEQV